MHTDEITIGRNPSLTLGVLSGIRDRELRRIARSKDSALVRTFHCVADKIHRYVGGIR